MNARNVEHATVKNAEVGDALIAEAKRREPWAWQRRNGENNDLDDPREQADFMRYGWRLELDH